MQIHGCAGHIWGTAYLAIHAVWKCSAMISNMINIILISIFDCSRRQCFKINSYYCLNQVCLLRQELFALWCPGSHPGALVLALGTRVLALALGDTFWKFIETLNRAQKRFNSIFIQNLNLKYSFNKIFCQKYSIKNLLKIIYFSNLEWRPVIWAMAESKRWCLP